MKKFEIFLSYNWCESDIADNIKNFFEKNTDINIHQDKIDIKKWSSIREYMQSIPEMDYTILLISDAYLKSSNCMYEVLEVMRDRKYKEKIFPVVIDKKIYDPIVRTKYVKYWQDEFNKLDENLSEINYQNIGNLGSDLKHIQNIAANIAEFLDLITSINNPEISDVCVAIENKLREKNFIAVKRENNDDIFKRIGISLEKEDIEITDWEMDKFILDCFKIINKLMFELCESLEAKCNINVNKMEKDSETYIYQFYKNGKLIKSIKIFLSRFLENMSIGISDNVDFISGNNSWNGMYTVKNVNNKLFLKSELSMNDVEKNMSSEDVVKDIYEKYIKFYLK